MTKKEKVSPRRRVYEVGMRALLYAAAALTVTLLVFLICYILYKGLPGLSWDFLTKQESVLRGTDGIWPAILNTLYVILVTLIFVLPLGVGAAIYLTEYARNRKLVSTIEFANETLAGIPSILYAMVGVLVFCQSLGLQKTLLAGSLTMVIMTLPTKFYNTGSPENRPPVLPGGCVRPGQWEMAHDPHSCAARVHGRYHYRLHFGCGSYRG